MRKKQAALRAEDSVLVIQDDQARSMRINYGLLRAGLDALEKTPAMGIVVTAHEGPEWTLRLER